MSTSLLLAERWASCTTDALSALEALHYARSCCCCCCCGRWQYRWVLSSVSSLTQRNASNARNARNARFYARNATYARCGQWHNWTLLHDMAGVKLERSISLARRALDLALLALRA